MGRQSWVLLAGRTSHSCGLLKATLASRLTRHKETPSLANYPGYPTTLHPAGDIKQTPFIEWTLKARKGLTFGLKRVRYILFKKKPSNLSCGLLDEMRMVEEVVMMEREVVVGGLQSPGLR